MTYAETIDNLATAKDAAMRVTARALIKAYGDQIEDFVTILGEELGKVSTDHAVRTGDYARATTLRLVGDHLTELDSKLENYDGADQ